MTQPYLTKISIRRENLEWETIRHSCIQHSMDLFSLMIEAGTRFETKHKISLSLVLAVANKIDSYLKKQRKRKKSMQFNFAEAYELLRLCLTYPLPVNNNYITYVIQELINELDYKLN